MIKKKVLCVVAGSSGGHIIPGITSICSALKQEPASEVLFFTTTSTLDQSILKDYSHRFTICALPIIPVPGKRIWLYPLFFLRMVQSFFMSFSRLRAMKPDEVISMGGLVALPVCFAARILRIQVVLFELNAVPGRAVKFLASLAQKVQVCFEEAGTFFDAKKVVSSAYPLRFTGEDTHSPLAALTHLGLDPDKRTLLIVGGSQGSLSINQLIKELFTQYPELLEDMNVIHQTGSYQVGQDAAQNWFARFYQERGGTALVVDFTSKLSYCYCAADLVIARAGAGTLFELEYFSKRSIIIPLEHSAQGHQLDNALAMVRRNPTLFSLVRQHHAEKSPTHLYDVIFKSLGPTEVLK